MTRLRGLGMLFAMFGALLLAACVQRAERADHTQPPIEPTAAPTAVPTALPSPTSTSQPIVSTASPTPAPQPVADSTVQRFGLFLEIEGLTDASIVRGDSVLARGQATPGAVVSINGVIVPVDAEGKFELLLNLDPGPNEFLVVASDLDGNELSKVLAVVSLPGEQA